jgi:hypothetical protein
MVGGGCRGLRLARELVAEGNAVRAVTRGEEGRAAIEAAGSECWIGDPDRIGTLRYALDNVTVLLWLLGTATGPNVADLHGSRLRMMLEKVTDTTVRGVLYEAAGTVGAEVLRSGAAEVARDPGRAARGRPARRGRLGRGGAGGDRAPAGGRSQRPGRLTRPARRALHSAKYLKADWISFQGGPRG